METAGLWQKNKRYQNPEYDDAAVEGLMKYFRFDRYLDFANFLKNLNKQK